MKCDHPAIVKCPEIKQRYKGNKTVHTYPFQILWFCGRAQQFTWLMLQSSSQAPVALPPFCPPNHLMHSLPTATGSHAVSHILLLLHKHSFITFHLTYSNIIHRKRMFSNNNMSVSIFLSFGTSRK